MVINWSILKCPVNNRNKDESISTMLHGLPKETVSQPLFPIILPAQALCPPTSTTLQMQTNAPSAYGRHTVAKSIFSFTKIRSALIKKTPIFPLLTALNYFVVPLEWAISLQEQSSNARKARVPAYLHARLHTHS